MLKLRKEGFSNIILILSTLIPIFLCKDEPSILLVPFKGKSLQKEEDPDDYSESYWSQEDEDFPYAPPKQIYNSSTFISHWFYNGMYSLTTIGSKMIESYINMENSKLTIEKCNINRVHSRSTMIQNAAYYKPLNSETYSKIDKKTGNDIFSFIGDFSYKTNINVGEKKGNGLV